MDPLSILASSTALFDALNKTIKFAIDVIHADAERSEFISRLSCVKLVVETINDRMAEDEDLSQEKWYQTLNPLSNEQSPLHKLRKIMMEMLKRLGVEEVLEKRSKFREGMRKWTWHYEKEKLEGMFGDIETCCGQITLVINLGQSKMLKRTKKTTDTILENQAREMEDKRREREEEERQKIEEWLSPLNFQAKQIELFEMAAQTGQWFLEGPSFNSFALGEIDELRCYGDAGSGKVNLYLSIKFWCGLN